MTAVSANRAQISLNNVQGSSSNTCSHDEQHYETKSILTPIRSGNNSNVSNTTINQRGNIDHTSLSRQQTSPPTHSCSSDSDVTVNTTSSSSATAMRRLYFKTAKLNRTTQNSITALHQQQAQHVPKVN